MVDLLQQDIQFIDHVLNEIDNQVVDDDEKRREESASFTIFHFLGMILFMFW